MSKALTVFDYAALDKDTKGKLVALAGQVKRYGESFKKSGLEIGQAISEAHQLLAGDGRDGKFKQWVATETDVGIRTAYDCMYVFERSKKLAEIASFPPSVAALLAAPSSPDAAIREVAKAVSKGQKPTVELAKATLKKLRTAVTRSQSSAATTTAPKAAPAAAETNVSASDDKENEAAPDDGPLNDEPVKELTFDEQVAEANSKIESFCRSLTKFFDDGCPKLGSIDYMGRFDSAKAQIKAACQTLRTCKYQEQPCPKCQGDGCSTCAKESDFGGVSVLTYRQLAG